MHLRSGWEEGVWTSLPAAPLQLTVLFYLQSDRELFPNHRQGARQYSPRLSRLGQSPSESKQTKLHSPGQEVKDWLGANPSQNRKPLPCSCVNCLVCLCPALAAP